MNTLIILMFHKHLQGPALEVLPIQNAVENSFFNIFIYYKSKNIPDIFYF